MGNLSVSEAAGHLGVSPARVRRRIAEGSLKASRVGHRWVIDAADLKPAAVARPLSKRMARWLMAAFAEEPLEAIDPVSRHRVNEYRRRLLVSDDPTVLLQAWLRRIEPPHYLAASDADIDAMRDDARLELAGISHQKSTISSPNVLEVRVSADQLPAVVADWFLVEVDRAQANVIAHVASLADSSVRLAFELSFHDGPREQRAARDLIRMAG